ncbi:hypothetical protein H6763_02120 [Candidatus Nomurabacteria bacterium]|nr:hypothetical protein [Candidatus Nomurabacteria bacterium]MCB9803603.1 hypothetical protein [Candidatus Nomurabacteria bacterium]
MTNRRKHSPKFKFTVALECIQSGQIGATARKYGITTGLASKWHKDLLSLGYSVFENKPEQEISKLQKHVKDLELLVGKKEVELSLLKNYLDFYRSPNGN